jgi:hypothetical protein
MSTCNELEAIDVVELSSDLVSKQPPCATRANSPSLDVFRIAPDKITKGTLVRYLLSSCYNADLVDGSDLGAKATVNTENLAINNSSQDQEVEHLAACLPDRGIAVLLLALLIEPVDLSDLSRFMVTTNKNNSIRIPVQQVNDLTTSCDSVLTHFAFRHIRRVKVSRLK